MVLSPGTPPLTKIPLLPVLRTWKFFLPHRSPTISPLHHFTAFPIFVPELPPGTSPHTKHKISVCEDPVSEKSKFQYLQGAQANAHVKSVGVALLCR